MAKGNIFLGDASGRVGSIVLSTRAGEMITRKYQSNVKNPKTNAQMAQRARFADAVKFYKHATQHFFYFAYEDKKKTESDFNAFMRHNLVGDNVLILPKTKVDGTFPAVAKSWKMTAGSLNKAVDLQVPTSYEDFHFELINPADSNQIVSNVEKEDYPTVGEFSKDLIALGNGVQEGDIITSVLVVSDVTKVSNENPANYPSWTVKQIRVNTSSNELLKDKLGVEVVSNDNGRHYVFGYASVATDSQVGWASIILTRLNDSQLYCDNSVLVCSSEDFIYSCVNAEDTSLVTWNPSGTAILKGGLSIQKTSFVSPALGSTGKISLRSTTSTQDATFEIEGTNLPELKASDFSIVQGSFSKAPEIKSVTNTSNLITVVVTVVGYVSGNASISLYGGVDNGGITWTYEVESTSSTSTIQNP